MKTRSSYTCPLELTHDLTKGKWKPLILWLLRDEDRSLSALKKSIHGISQKMLIEQLQELQAVAMVERTQYNGYPLRVSYSLRERGRKMLQAIVIMQEIGVELMREDGRDDFLRELGLL